MLLKQSVIIVPVNSSDIRYMYLHFRQDFYHNEFYLGDSNIQINAKVKVKHGS